jgi:hypothetical protein
LKKTIGSSSREKTIEFDFNFIFFGCHPLIPKIRLSSILKKLRSSSILKKIEFVFNISSWVKIRLHTENQLPGLPRTALTVMTPWCGGGGVVVVVVFSYR